MAASFSTLRSPVMSIRTQPAEEDSLRAEIEAASRTQQQISPRHSWQSAIVKKDNLINSRQAHSAALRNIASNQMGSTDDLDDDGSLFAEYASMSPGAAKDALSFLRPSTTTTKPWRQLTRRITQTSGSIMPKLSDSTRKFSEEAGKRYRNTSQKKHRDQDDGIVADEDRAAQHAQFNAWLEERLEEQNNLEDLTSPPVQKSKRTVRRSVYGSLSSTKNFLRGTSKNPLDKLRGCNTNNSSNTPHVYSFETKDQLRDYLNQYPSSSPLSPLHSSQQILSVAEGIEPVELSAGPIPAELDGTIADVLTNQQTTVSRTSSPSIPDLPPYIDDKKFRADIAKDQSIQAKQSVDASYVCSSCEKNIGSRDVYDFCSICDTNDRVLCNDCAKRGPCCQHELEGLLRACALGQSMSAQRGPSESISEAVQAADRSPNIATNSSALLQCSRSYNGQITSVETLPTRSTSSSSAAREAIAESRQQDVMKEVNNLHREHDLVHRERELGLRMREIELRDQQITLREREAIVQQRSDLLLRNLESIVASTKMPVQPFIGAQFQPQQNAQLQSDTYQPSIWTNNPAQKTGPIPTEHSDQVVHVKSLNNDAVSTYDLLHHNGSAKSSAAQKRKKESASTGTSTTDSTPAAASSPEQTRNSLSRGNSERDASQDEEEEEGHRRNPKKNKQDISPPNGPQNLFACPFAKQNPLRFSSRNVAEKNYRGCATHYLPDVSRLKQHLKRVHWQPEIYCPRCYEEFADTAKLTEHASAQVVCRVKSCPFPEKMDKAKQEKIHTKRPRVPSQTVWYDIFKVLFPDSPLPESPYPDANDRIVTPVSATPQNSTNMEAVQMLSNIFNNRLNQHEVMQNNPWRSIIQSTLHESFAELLGSFSISPCASPGTGPSIMVSPVSRSSLDDGRVSGSIFASTSRPSGSECFAAAINVTPQPQQVPQLQQPRPPKPRLNTALQVPQDHHRSPIGHNRVDSADSGSPADIIFSINILPHIQDDPGYDDECRSYEQGDDLQAMGVTNEPVLPAYRTKSVMSLDSGYGSGRSQHQAYQPIPMATPHVQQRDYTTDAAVMQGVKPQNVSPPHDFAPVVGPSLFAPPVTHTTDYGTEDFPSYSNYLDSYSQDIIGSDDFFSGQINPWNLP